MSNLCGIRQEIFNNGTIRLVVKVKTDSRDSDDCRSLAYKVVNEVFPNWDQDSRVLFLAIEVWDNRILVGIDINRHDYNYSTAHKDNTILPVYVLQMHRKKWVLVRWPREDESAAAKLAELHRVVGYDTATPFFENHNTRNVHAHPREYST
jgi:hypothetical protein